MDHNQDLDQMSMEELKCELARFRSQNSLNRFERFKNLNYIRNSISAIEIEAENLRNGCHHLAERLNEIQSDLGNIINVDQSMYSIVEPTIQTINIDDSDIQNSKSSLYNDYRTSKEKRRGRLTGWNQKSPYRWRMDDDNSIGIPVETPRRNPYQVSDSNLRSVDNRNLTTSFVLDRTTDFDDASSSKPKNLHSTVSKSSKTITKSHNHQSSSKSFLETSPKNAHESRLCRRHNRRQRNVEEEDDQEDDPYNINNTTIIVNHQTPTAGSADSLASNRKEYRFFKSRSKPEAVERFKNDLETMIASTSSKANSSIPTISTRNQGKAKRVLQLPVQEEQEESKKPKRTRKKKAN